MVPEVNFLTIVMCAIASMVLGATWYGPLFGKEWIKGMGFTKGDIEKAQKKGMGWQYGAQFVSSLVMAYILSHMIAFAGNYMGTSGVGVGISTGFWVWLGFTVPVTLQSVFWEGKVWKLWGINNGYNLVNLLVMGVILTSF